jgi:hypothetical protein
MTDVASTKIVYTIVERDGKPQWHRIGVAHVNTDGSLVVKLEALPVSGELEIHDEPVPGEAQ